jgi:hypothetical protein
MVDIVQMRSILQVEKKGFCMPIEDSLGDASKHVPVRSSLVFPEMHYALIISAMPSYDLTGDGINERLCEGRLTGAEIRTEFFKVQKGPDPLESTRLVVIGDDDKKFTSSRRQGFKRIHSLLEKDSDAKDAFEFILSEFYLAARQKGVEAAADRLAELVKHERI